MEYESRKASPDFLKPRDMYALYPPKCDHGMYMDVSHYAVCFLYYVASIVCEVAWIVSDPWSPQPNPPLSLISLTVFRK